MKCEVVQIKGMTANAYLLTGGHTLLVDTLEPGSFRRIKRALEDRHLDIKDIDFIFITHYHNDHTGNLAKLKEISGAVVIAGVADAPVIEGKEDPALPGDFSSPGRIAGKIPGSLWKKYISPRSVVVDRRVSEGDRIEEMGLEVISLPGHTRGGVGLYDKEGRRAFSGDLVSNIFGRIGMPVLMSSYSLQEILASHAKLASLELDVDFPGHGRVIRPDASKRIGEMLKENRFKYFNDRPMKI